MPAESRDPTQLLQAAAAGDREALGALLPVFYDELRRLAAAQMRRERGEHTLQPTALVHEAWLRLLGSPPGAITDRAHVFGVAAEAMRRVLVDHARSRAAAKRGAERQRVTFADLQIASEDPGHDLIALDEALDRLAALEPRAARVVELRYFAGMSVEETAAALVVSEPTVKRDWAYARAWLEVELGRD
ncbi:MAG: sigma-70 family RNA polymerase sigma factor [Planctomycetota bacterium]